jgi:hypothetical protein
LYVSQALDDAFIRAIVEFSVFLEFSPERIIDPDAAVEVFEQLAATLQSGGSEARSCFCSRVPVMAAKYSGAQSDFVRSLPENLGLNSL